MKKKSEYVTYVLIIVAVAVLVFAIIAGLGLFVALAGGVKWGTGDAAVCAGMTCLLGVLAAVLVGAAVKDELF